MFASNVLLRQSGSFGGAASLDPGSAPGFGAIFEIAGVAPCLGVTVLGLPGVCEVEVDYRLISFVEICLSSSANGTFLSQCAASAGKD